MGNIMTLKNFILTKKNRNYENEDTYILLLLLLTIYITTVLRIVILLNSRYILQITIRKFKIRSVHYTKLSNINWIGSPFWYTVQWFMQVIAKIYQQFYLYFNLQTYKCTCTFSRNFRKTVFWYNWLTIKKYEIQNDSIFITRWR